MKLTDGQAYRLLVESKDRLAGSLAEYARERSCRYGIGIYLYR